MTINVIVSDLRKEEARLLSELERVRGAICLLQCDLEESSDLKTILEGCESVLRINNAPMRRRQILTKLKEIGIIVPGKTPAKNLGTILWRYKDRFFRIPKMGYWIEPEFKECEA
jgi:hypothetical protein